MRRSASLLLTLSLLVAAATGAVAQSKEPVKIGLSAAVSGGSAASGEAIKRGLGIAIGEINAKGAVFGGLHTPVALAQVAVWHELKTPYMGAWAAGTNITRNGQSPNYVFRVSANDDDADKFLTRYATEVLRKGKPGLLLENTSWGQSNEAGLTKWLGEKGIRAVGIE